MSPARSINSQRTVHRLQVRNSSATSSASSKSTKLDDILHESDLLDLAPEFAHFDSTGGSAVDEDVVFTPGDHSLSSIAHTSSSRLSTPPLPLPSEHDCLQRCISPVQDSAGPRHFQRWLSTLRRRKRQSAVGLTTPEHRFVLDDFDRASRESAHCDASTLRKSNSITTSLGFVTAIRSATATLASASIASVSRRKNRRRTSQQPSSLTSTRDMRGSFESRRSVVDQATAQRARKRKIKIEELVKTEESYVADLRAFNKAYNTVLEQATTTTSFVRPSMTRILNEMLDLHEAILSELHRVVPFSLHEQASKASSKQSVRATHARWHSIDAITTMPLSPIRPAVTSFRQQRRSLNIAPPVEVTHTTALCFPPHIVALAAHAIRSQLGRFAVYDRYAAKYELMQQDIDELRQMMQSWPEYDRAFEALASYINPTRSWPENYKKAMTMKDLMIKPVQRLTRYELLISELAEVTPVCDDTTTFAAVEDLHSKLVALCHRVDRAKEFPAEAELLEITSILCDRLNFSSQLPRSIFQQLLGRVILCGCLYTAYRGRDRIKGSYLVCMLFETSVLLATKGEGGQHFQILIAIPLAQATVEETDNGRGLQCHSAPHAWKIVFEHGARMFEVILVACSAVEAEVWRTRLTSGIELQTSITLDNKCNALELHSPLLTGLRSIGKAFGRPGNSIRQMSIHRAATVGPSSNITQVIIKNTQAVKVGHDNSSQTRISIPRSQSVATTGHIPVLAPRRADRVRIETLLSDVWTRDRLPYPGMMRRTDPIRASANSVMRKFSMASISSNFSTKRSASYTTINSTRSDNALQKAWAKPKSKSIDSIGCSSGLSKPTPINFHTAPDAFLPADFDLDATQSTRHKLGLRSLTMTLERPFSPAQGVEGQRWKLQQGHRISDTRSNPNATVHLSTQRSGNETVTITNAGRQPDLLTTPIPSSLSNAFVGTGTENHCPKTLQKARGMNKLRRLFG